MIVELQTWKPADKDGTYHASELLEYKDKMAAFEQEVLAKYTDCEAEINTLLTSFTAIAENSVKLPTPPPPPKEDIKKKPTADKKTAVVRKKPVITVTAV